MASTSAGVIGPVGAQLDHQDPAEGAGGPVGLDDADAGLELAADQPVDRRRRARSAVSSGWMSSRIESPTAVTGPAIGDGTVAVVVVGTGGRGRWSAGAAVTEGRRGRGWPARTSGAAGRGPACRTGPGRPGRPARASSTAPMTRSTRLMPDTPPVSPHRPRRTGGRAPGPVGARRRDVPARLGRTRRLGTVDGVDDSPVATASTGGACRRAAAAGDEDRARPDPGPSPTWSPSSAWPASRSTSGCSSAPTAARSPRPACWPCSAPPTGSTATSPAGSTRSRPSARSSTRWPTGCWW